MISGATRWHSRRLPFHLATREVRGEAKAAWRGQPPPRAGSDRCRSARAVGALFPPPSTNKSWRSRRKMPQKVKSSSPNVWCSLHSSPTPRASTATSLATRRHSQPRSPAHRAPPPPRSHRNRPNPLHLPRQPLRRITRPAPQPTPTPRHPKEPKLPTRIQDPTPTARPESHPGRRASSKCLHA